jgi:AraC-like DNA-binding protein
MVACEACERTANVTLLEIAAAAGVSRDSLLSRRLGDVAALAFAAKPPARATEWSETVRAVLGGGLSNTTSLRSVARALAVSPRTLQRRLADDGTSWRGVLDAARCERATELLRQGAGAEVVAHEIGYSGSRALRRALRRWQVGASGPQVVASRPTASSEPLAMSRGNI